LKVLPTKFNDITQLEQSIGKFEQLAGYFKLCAAKLANSRLRIQL